jgi:hypothetical protein
MCLGCVRFSVWLCVWLCVCMCVCVSFTSIQHRIDRPRAELDAGIVVREGEEQLSLAGACVAAVAQAPSHLQAPRAVEDGWGGDMQRLLARLFGDTEIFREKSSQTKYGAKDIAACGLWILPKGHTPRSTSHCSTPQRHSAACSPHHIGHPIAVQPREAVDDLGPEHLLLPHII